jgi:hypothetical protein
VTTFCRNRLTVTGAGDVLESFVAGVETDEQPLSFETIAPTPKELLKSGWYEWRIERETREPPQEGRARSEARAPYGVHSPTEPA